MFGGLRSTTMRIGNSGNDGGMYFDRHGEGNLLVSLSDLSGDDFGARM